MASPSLKNSGFETTEKSFLDTFFEIIFSTSSHVPTGIENLETYYFIFSNNDVNQFNKL